METLTCHDCQNYRHGSCTSFCSLMMRDIQRDTFCEFFTVRVYSYRPDNGERRRMTDALP